MARSDAAARERALDTTASFIVQAPAGSGKTELLIQRYLALLAVVEEPERIVAITFTKKAAAEMRARVVNALANVDGEPQAEHERVTRSLARAALDRDRAKHWGLIGNPSRMRIDTFDALCLRIASQMPWMARLGSMPSPVEKPEELYREAARETIAMVAGNSPVASALRRLLLHFDNDAGALAAQLAGMLEKREQWLHLVVSATIGDMHAVRSSLEESLREVITENLARVRRLVTGDIAAGIVRFACRESRVLPGTTAVDLEAWVAIANLLLTNDGKWRLTVNKRHGYLPHDKLRPGCIAFLESLSGKHEQLRQELGAIRGLPAPLFDAAQWQIVCAVFEVLRIAAAQLDSTFADQSKVDFSALLLAAIHALGPEDDPTDLALSLGSRIEHILVDEFQDTSRTQLRLLQKLTAGWIHGDGRTLFLVGDPMQSVYRFRQAEVGIFLKVRTEGLGNVYPEPLTLSENFRSRPEIVAWVNAVFGRILSDAEDPLTGSVHYTPFIAAGVESGPAPCVHPFFGKSQTEEADCVVSLIPPAGTCGILVRARTHLTHVIAALRRANIPFQAIEIYQLGERPVVQDLMALTFALLHPADRVSWLAILRAPWCGLTLADLHALSALDRKAPLWSLIDDAVPALSAEGVARLERIRPAIDRALDERGRRTLRELVQGAWLLLSGPAFAESEADLEDAAAYFDLLETAGEGGDLSRFGDLRAQVQDLFARPDTQADGRLQVMTIHQAKGLQFDTVILPGLGANTRPDDRPLLLFHEFASQGLLVAAKPEAREDRLYSYIRAHESEKSANETKRLLYVAATRARTALHLLGSVNVSAPARGSFLDLLWEDVKPVFDAELARRAGDLVTPQEEIKPARRIRRVNLAWRAPAPPPAMVWERDEEPGVDETPVTFEWVGDTLRHVGTVLHNWLQRIAETDVETWTPARIHSLRPATLAALAGLGVPPAELEHASETVAAGLLNCVAGERTRWILSRHAEAECECEFTAWLDGRFQRVRIDRTFLDEHGVRWLIDYKSSTHQGGSRDEFLANEQRRYRDQLDGYARIVAKTDPRPIRVALCFPLLGEWIAWEPAATVEAIVASTA